METVALLRSTAPSQAYTERLSRPSPSQDRNASAGAGAAASPIAAATATYPPI